MEENRVQKEVTQIVNEGPSKELWDEVLSRNGDGPEQNHRVQPKRRRRERRSEQGAENALPPPRFMDLTVWWDGPVGFPEKQVEQPRRAGLEDIRQEGADEGGSIAATIRGLKKRGRG